MTCLLKISNPSKVATGVQCICSGHCWPKGVIVTFVHSFLHSNQNAIKLR